jgi:hypothetical protein
MCPVAGYPMYYPPPQSARPPLKPGCVPLRPLSVSDILDGSFQVVRRNPRATLGISAVLAVLQAIAVALFQIAVYSAQSSGDSEQVSGQLIGQLTAAFSLLVVSTLIGAILTGMLAAVVTEDVLGIKLTIDQAWRRARPRIWSLVGLAITTTILETLGLLPCLVLGVWLWGIWAVSVPAMMVEGTTIRGSLGRSRQLVSGMFWRVWGIRALGALLVAVVGGIIGAPFQIAGSAVNGGLNVTPGTVPTTLIVLTAIGSILSTTVTAPIRAAIDSLLYVDLRMRKEGLDLVLQQRVAPTPPPVPPLPQW